MVSKSNLIVILGLSLIFYPSQSKEISKNLDNPSSSVEAIAEKMINLNSSLDLLSITINNLVPANNI